MKSISIATKTRTNVTVNGHDSWEAAYEAARQQWQAASGGAN